MIPGLLADLDEDALRLAFAGRPITELGEHLDVVAGLDPPSDGRDGHLVAGPGEHRHERALFAERRSRADLVNPVEKGHERLGVEPLVVDRAEVPGSLEELRHRAALGLGGGPGEPEARRGDEQVARRVVGDGVAHDPVSLCAKWQGVHRILGARRRLGLVERPLVEVEDGRPRLGPDAEPELDPLGEDDLFLRGEQRYSRDLPQVQPR